MRREITTCQFWTSPFYIAFGPDGDPSELEHHVHFSLSLAYTNYPLVRIISACLASGWDAIGTSILIIIYYYLLLFITIYYYLLLSITIHYYPLLSITIHYYPFPLTTITALSFTSLFFFFFAGPAGYVVVCIFLVPYLNHFVYYKSILY